MLVLRITNLSKAYRKYGVDDDSFIGLAKNFVMRRYEMVKAVDDVSFTVEPGTCVGLLGANGAGKTTLVKMLSGLLVPSSGDAVVLGFTPWDRQDDFLRQIGVVMGSRQQLWIDVSAYENFRLNQIVYNISDNDFKQRIKQLSQVLDVEQHLHTQIRKLSLGEKMKLELMAAFLHRPRLLFLDEPTIGLDVVAQQNIREFVRTQVQQEGVTVLLTSHYMKDLEALCSRVLLVQNGALLHDGLLTDLVSKFSTTKRVVWHSRDGLDPKLQTLKPTQASPGRFVLEVDSKQISSVVRTLLDSTGVDDLSIEPRPLEDSVREIFLSRRTGKS
jgi:ABC-2 type transport system ATP-binding protein